MIDSITTNLFVVLVYLIPGALLLLSIYLYKPEIFTNNDFINKKNTIYITYICALSFFFGVVLHALSYFVFLFIRFFISDYHQFFRNLWVNLSGYTDIEIIFANKKLLPIEKTIDYLFLETIAKEKTKIITETISRQEALSYLCKNCIIPSIIFLHWLFFYHIKQLKWKRLSFFISTLLMSLILATCSFYYLCLRIDAVLRSAILIK